MIVKARLGTVRASEARAELLAVTAEVTDQFEALVARHEAEHPDAKRAPLLDLARVAGVPSERLALLAT